MGKRRAKKSSGVDPSVDKIFEALPQSAVILTYETENSMERFAFSSENQIVSVIAHGGHHIVMSRKSMFRMAEMAEEFFRTGEMNEPEWAKHTTWRKGNGDQEGKESQETAA